MSRLNLICIVAIVDSDNGKFSFRSDRALSTLRIVDYRTFFVTSRSPFVG